MAPIAIAQLISQLLPYGIEFVQGIISLIHTSNPTAADWKAVLDKAQIPFDQGLNPGVLLPAKSTVVTETVTTKNP